MSALGALHWGKERFRSRQKENNDENKIGRRESREKWRSGRQG